MLKNSRKLISMPCYLNIFRINKGRFYFACDPLVRDNDIKSNFNVKVVKSPSTTLFFPMFDEKLRFKSKSHGKKQLSKKDDESSDEEEQDEDNEIDDGDGKTQVLRLKSIRADNVLKTCFKLSKRKLEEVIFLNKVKLNNEVLTKKGIDLTTGDVLELYGESTVIESGNTVIGRIEVLNVDPQVEASLIAIKVKITKTN